MTDPNRWALGHSFQLSSNHIHHRSRPPHLRLSPWGVRHTSSTFHQGLLQAISPKMGRLSIPASSLRLEVAFTLFLSILDPRQAEFLGLVHKRPLTLNSRCKDVSHVQDSFKGR